MGTIQVRSSGTFGFDVTSLSGLDLSTSDAATTRARVDDALNLADAIRSALAAARGGGVSAFKPSDAPLILPAGMTDARRDFLFENVIGRPYSSGPMDMQAWSRAIDDLERFAGAQGSMLPSEAGGGSHTVQGIWYVNGLPWSLSELFTVNRVNTLAEIDRLVANSLNVIAANNDAAKGLTALMAEMFNQYKTMGLTETMTKYEVGHMGQTDPDHTVEFTQLLSFADKYIGPNSLTRKLNDQSPFTASSWNAQTYYNKGDVVMQDGKGYQAKATNTSTAYSATAQYHEGDAVYHLGTLYELTKEQKREGDNYTLGVNPTNTEYWKKTGTYDNETYYFLNSLVYFEGKYYKLLIEDNRTWPAHNATRRKSPKDYPNYWAEYTDFGIPVLRNVQPPNSTYWTPLSEAGLNKEDFRAMIDEVQNIIGAFGSDNQVAQLRNETLFNSRSNLLEGLSAFLKGQQSTRSTLARNA